MDLMNMTNEELVHYVREQEKLKIRLKELGEISDKIMEIDGRMVDTITAIDMLEFRAEDMKDTTCAAILCFLLFHLKHIETELNEYGNKLDMLWLHLR